jgi:exodeoxyribonuclease VII large subunit
VAFEQLKKKLQQEGLFDDSHKKKIPKIPNRIGIITAPTGAAIKDILSTLKRRWPLAETILFPSLVQGMEAATDIVKNINIAKNFDLDVLIVGRGGGSIEDLWCFNEEIVARAIYDLDIPVISAVGHEIDFTISDFVADLRAPTPTGAAEMAVPDIRDITKLLNQLEIRTVNSISNIVNINKERLQKIDKSYVLKNPLTMYEIKEQKFDSLFERLNNGFKNIININQNRLILIDNKLENSIESTLNKEKNEFLKILGKLEVLNPMLTIKRGYSVIRKDNKVISSVKDVKIKDNLELELKDGKINVEVK